jgi:hypothetical protein
MIFIADFAHGDHPGDDSGEWGDNIAKNLLAEIPSCFYRHPPV